MAFSQAQLDKLNEAIAGGVRVVEYEGKKITYHSVDEMIKLRDLMTRELSGTRGGLRTTQAEFIR